MADFSEKLTIPTTYIGGNQLILNFLFSCVGGGSGIGRAVCHVLAREGARVVVADLNSIAAEETKKHLDDIGSSGVFIFISFNLLAITIFQVVDMNIWPSLWMSQ